MRRYTININGTQHEIDVAEASADSFVVYMDDQEVEVRLVDHQDVAQAVISPEVTPGYQTYQSADQGPIVHRPQGVDSVAGGQVAAVKSVAKSAPKATAPSAPTPSTPVAGAGDMTAPMPGVVLSVDAKAGQQVSRGDLLLVLEAMKMKNEIRATRDGQIAEIPVAEGAQVKFGDVLVRFA